jgi:hypothetical protein
LEIKPSPDRKDIGEVKTREIDPTLLESIRASLLRYRAERIRADRILRRAEKEIRLYGANAPRELMQVKREFIEEQRKHIDLLSRLVRQCRNWLAQADRQSAQ